MSAASPAPRTVDTAKDCAKVTPLDYKGNASVWWTGPNEASPDIDRKVHEEFWAAWKATYPNIETDYQNIDYNQLLDKLRTATLGNAAPMVVRLQILGGVEFASQGLLPGAEARGCRLSDRRLLARRDEVGHV